MGKAIESEIIKTLHMLEQSQQSRVLTYIKSLLKTKVKSKKSVEDFVGILDKKDAEEMKKIISEGCEKIDYNEW